MSENPPVFTEEHYNDLEFVREGVFEALQKEPTPSQTSSLRCRVECAQQHRDRFDYLVQVVVWQLAVQGIIVPGGYGRLSHDNLPFFTISEYGKKVLKERRFSPYDPTGYMEEVRKAKTILGNVAEAYVEEALRCFNSRCYVAAVLLLGVAAEAVFWRVDEEVAKTLKSEKGRNRYEKLGIGIKKHHRWVVAQYEKVEKEIGEYLPESLDLTLKYLGDMIRRQRNDLGHPQLESCSVDREQAFAFFRLFAASVKDLEAFAQYIGEYGFAEPESKEESLT